MASTKKRILPQSLSSQRQGGGRDTNSNVKAQKRRRRRRKLRTQRRKRERIRKRRGRSCGVASPCLETDSPISTAATQPPLASSCYTSSLPSSPPTSGSSGSHSSSNKTVFSASTSPLRVDLKRCRLHSHLESPSPFGSDVGSLDPSPACASTQALPPGSCLARSMQPPSNFHQPALVLSLALGLPTPTASGATSSPCIGDCDVEKMEEGVTRRRMANNCSLSECITVIKDQAMEVQRNLATRKKLKAQVDEDEQELDDDIMIDKHFGDSDESDESVQFLDVADMDSTHPPAPPSSSSSSPERTVIPTTAVIAASSSTAALAGAVHSMESRSGQTSAKPDGVQAKKGPRDDSAEFRGDYGYAKVMCNVFNRVFGLKKFRPNQLEAVTAIVGPTVSDTKEDQLKAECYKALCRLRLDIANRHKLKNPEYILASASLQAMSRLLPTTKEELLVVEGYTEVQWNRFEGEEFLKITREFSQEVAKLAKTEEGGSVTEGTAGRETTSCTSRATREEVCDPLWETASIRRLGILPPNPRDQPFPY